VNTLHSIQPLPPSSHAKPVDSFAQASELEHELKRVVRGEVRFDRGSRALYATDASNYRQFPIGLVVPRDSADVVAAVATCKKFSAPVLPRGAGTSLAGQSCNVALVLDFTKYMNQILELNFEQMYARVQPGVVLDAIRDRAETHGLTFAPDPSTHNRCTIGGMIGNNSCGTHSLLGGKTVDNVEELKILLYDGTQMRSLRASFAKAGAAVRSMRSCKQSATSTPTLFARVFRVFRAASPGTTSTSCFQRTAFTLRALSSDPKALA
jgi:FAD/FMN-containing dehydrogenase